MRVVVGDDRKFQGQDERFCVVRAAPPVAGCGIVVNSDTRCLSSCFLNAEPLAHV